MSTKASEMTKLSINSMVAHKVSYSNMIGDIATKMGFKSEMNLIFKAIGADKRIGEKYLNYNFGFDGPHLYGDNKSLNHFIKKIEIDNSLIHGVEDFNESHLIFLKNYYLNLNPDKNIPFIINGIGFKKINGLVENSKKYQLCISLLEEGYTLNVIETNEIAKKLNSLSESYNNRLKFFSINTEPKGYKINL
jgi:UDPglucose 6-dehydrogenase